MHNPLEVAIVSSNLRNRQYVANMLSRLGIDSICLASVEQCRQIPRRHNVGLVFCDTLMKDGNYQDVLSAFASSSPNPKVVMMSQSASPEEYRLAKGHGIFDVISSPLRPTDVEWMIIQAKRESRHGLKHMERSNEIELIEKTARVGA